MDCSCDFDPAEFYSCETHRAQKRYRCEECPGDILPGEAHEYVSGKWDGYFSTFRTCQRCVDLRQWVKNNVPCVCWAHGDMINGLREAVDDAYYRAKDEVVGLRFGFLRRIVLRDRFNVARTSTVAA